MPEAHAIEYHPSSKEESFQVPEPTSLEDFREVQRIAHLLMQPELRILLALAGYPEGLTAKEIRQSAGIDEALIFKRLPGLVKEGRIVAAPIVGAPKVFGRTPMRYWLARGGDAR